MNSFFQTQNLLAAIALGTVGLAATASTAEAFTIKGNVTQSDYDTFLNGEEVPWAAESRIGLPSDGEKEVNIHDATNSSSGTRVDKNFNWVNGNIKDEETGESKGTVNFSLVFDKAAKTLTYLVDDVEVKVTNIAEENFSDLFIRTSARKDNTSVIVNNLFLRDEATLRTAINGMSSAACSGGAGCNSDDADYFHISDITGSFTLEGTSTMFWGSERPSRSHLAYQIKLVEGYPEPPVDVPAPAGLPFLSIGLAALRRKFSGKTE